MVEYGFDNGPECWIAEIDSVNLLIDAISMALSGNRCVSVWLGYGNVLFLGFGVESMPARNLDGKRPTPPYELQTESASWILRGPTAACSEDDRLSANQALAGLLGQAVVAWRLDDNRCLQIEFSDNGAMEIIPSVKADSDSQQWWFCLPGSKFVGIGVGGRVISGTTDRPIESQSS